MTNYDYLVLSLEEFENSSRDVFQKVKNLILGSAATGKDRYIEELSTKITYRRRYYRKAWDY